MPKLIITIALGFMAIFMRITLETYPNVGGLLQPGNTLPGLCCRKLVNFFLQPIYGGTLIKANRLSSLGPGCGKQLCKSDNLSCLIFDVVLLLTQLPYQSHTGIQTPSQRFRILGK